MKKYILSLAAVCCMLTFFSISASALEYIFDAPDAGLFGRPTSDNTIYVTTDEPANTNRGKDAAYIPPAFGSPTSYTLNAGERLTPNLVSGQRHRRRDDTAFEWSRKRELELSAHRLHRRDK